MYKTLFRSIPVACLLISFSAFARVSTLDCQQGDFHLTITKNLTQVDNGTAGTAGLNLSFSGNLSVGNVQGGANIQNVVKADPGSNIYDVRGTDGSSLSSRFVSSQFALNHIFITQDGRPLGLTGSLSGYIDGQVTTLDATVTGAASEQVRSVPCSYQIHD